MRRKHRKHRGPYRVEPFLPSGPLSEVPASLRKLYLTGWGVVPYRCRDYIEAWWPVQSDGIDTSDCYRNACRRRDQLNGVGVDGPKKERIRREWGR